MSDVRAELVQKLWHGNDPFSSFDPSGIPVDTQGWGSTHPYLAQSVREVQPALVIEIGAWKGGSVITLAKAIRDLGLNGVVLAVDTWLGSAEHWADPAMFASLRIAQGYPSLYRTFMANIIREGLEPYVLPLPLDSVNAGVLLRARKISAQMLHIDAGHDYRSVSSDLNQWWPLLEPGGILIGDDYRLDGHFPGVRRAFDELAAATGLMLEHAPTKCRIRKS
ncbi:class I SAM-dependent methyltransferase [Xanthobacter sp. DSM 24535]|uniref:class I SAM-dependent methyltransferase n=1 Tax=Roseixanthobacter psychrophilus TaxID=3119917 RepID=UPI00372735F2